MTPARRQDVPSLIQARVPHELYEAVDAHADHWNVTLSEALRRLLVQALEANDWAPTADYDGTGQKPQHGWKAPPDGFVDDTTSSAESAEAPASHRAS